jgi:hypothetical protein
MGRSTSGAFQARVSNAICRRYPEQGFGFIVAFWADNHPRGLLDRICKRLLGFLVNCRFGHQPFLDRAEKSGSEKMIHAFVHQDDVMLVEKHHCNCFNPREWMSQKEKLVHYGLSSICNRCEEISPVKALMWCCSAKIAN